MKYKHTTTKEMANIIKSLKAKDSCGNEISMKILKTSLHFIMSPLNYKCNKALSKDIFPERLEFSVKMVVSFICLIIDQYHF